MFVSMSYPPQSDAPPRRDAARYASIQWRVRLTDRGGAEASHQGVTVVQVRHGKTILVQEFLFDLSPALIRASRPGGD
jgi:hypothetical protein